MKRLYEIQIKKKVDQADTLIDPKHPPNTIILKGMLWIRLAY